jgi:hypothetical protein
MNPVHILMPFFYECQQLAEISGGKLQNMEECMFGDSNELDILVHICDQVKGKGKVVPMLF